MNLKLISVPLSVCKLRRDAAINWNAPFCFVGKTDEELSLVCPTDEVPPETEARDDGWRGFRIEGILDFSLVGVLARLSNLLSLDGIGIFAISTYNTDYILVKEENLNRAIRVLQENGYRFAD